MDYWGCGGEGGEGGEGGAYDSKNIFCLLPYLLWKGNNVYLSARHKSCSRKSYKMTEFIFTKHRTNIKSNKTMMCKGTLL